MAEEIIDETSRSLESSADSQEPAAPGTEANADGSSASEAEGKVPWDGDPRWKTWRGNEKKINEIMETHGYDNLDTMLDDAATSKKLQEELGTEDIRSLIEAGQAAQQEVDKIHAYWAENEMKHKKEEDPDAYVEELEKKLKLVETSSKEEAEARRKQEESDKFLSRYDNYTDSFIKSKEARPEAQKEFLRAILKSDSFINDVNINSQSDVKTMLAKIDSMMDDYNQSVIEDYRNGKIDTPKISSTDATPTTIKEKTPSTFADAKKQVLEILKKQRGVE